MWVLNHFSRVWLFVTLQTSLSCSSDHGVLQARMLKWVAIPFFRGSSWVRDRTLIACIAGRFFTVWGTCEAQLNRWPLAINSVMSSLYPLPRGGDIRAKGEVRGNWKCQPSNKWLILLVVSPPFSGYIRTFKKSPHLHNKRYLYKDTYIYTSLVAQSVKNLPTMQEIQVQSLGWEDSPEKEMAAHSSILAWRIPWTEKPGRLQSMGSQELDTT